MNKNRATSHVQKVIQIRSSLLWSISKLDQHLYACIVKRFADLVGGGRGMIRLRQEDTSEGAEASQY
jgi:hypothetical protein